MSSCVIGAGIIGHSTAVEIQRKEPRAKVTLIAEQFSPDTTSDIAAGWWHPTSVVDTRTNLLKRWGQKTFDLMRDLYKTDADRYGAGMVSGYHLFDSIQPDPFWSDVVLNFRHPSKTELNQLGYEFARDAYFWTDFYLECSRYLPILQAEFLANGGIVERRKIGSLSEVSSYDVIVNCTGLNAYQLVGDSECYPIRGQIYRVSAPHIKHFLLYRNSYVIPNHNCIVVGGCKQKGNWSTAVDTADSKEIWSNAVSLMPSLKSGKILGEQVGLRPGRDQVRLEMQMATVDHKVKPIVHNYGHAGMGVTFHYGCALDAADLTVSALHSRAKL